MAGFHSLPKDKRFKDLTGQVFGRLNVLGYMGRKICGETRIHFWRCQCECGNKTIVGRGSLRSGNTKSCGCLKMDTLTTHGMCDTDTYQIWANMLTRCNSQNHRDYHRYGGRGICVCERWHDFANFLADMGERPEGRSIDRIDNERNYEPGNCRWATKLEQDNNRRTSRHITYNEKTQTLSQWAREIGMHYRTLSNRLKKMSIETAITTPIDQKFRNKRVTHTHLDNRG